MAGNKCGMSMEEKKKAMMDLFYEKKDFFQLKELEEIASKEKGIDQGTVKDVIQGLVDDGFVDTDKIGTFNYFWAFPSKALYLKEQKLKELQKQNEVLKMTSKSILKTSDIEAKLANLQVSIYN